MEALHIVAVKLLLPISKIDWDTVKFIDSFHTHGFLTMGDTKLICPDILTHTNIHTHMHTHTSTHTVLRPIHYVL